MVVSTTLEVYLSIFQITEHNKKVQLYIFPESKLGVISYEKVREDIEKD